MCATTEVRVFRAYDHGRLAGIGLSEEQLRRGFPDLCRPGWSVESSLECVPEAMGIVINWYEHGGSGGDHAHWPCPICGGAHETDIDTRVEPNPTLWFCERGDAYSDVCLVHWRHERDCALDPGD